MVERAGFASGSRRGPSLPWHLALLARAEGKQLCRAGGEVQKERGHKVVSTGPYAYVRHPMYASVILFAAGVPLLLGSWWGFVVSPLLVLGLASRAVMEERMLKAELEGYADYTERVRYRFVPLLW
jgi:protein-S-isoprenylcysteine O-methyltransferase Ste14